MEEDKMFDEKFFKKIEKLMDHIKDMWINTTIRWKNTLPH